MVAPMPGRSKRRAAWGAIGLVLGALPPVVTGIVGLWDYLTQGYFISKTGERIDGPAGIVMSGLFILAGLGMIAYALWSYRRQGA